MENQRIKVVNPNDSWFGTECYIGEHKISNVKNIDFHVGVEEIPTFTFETHGIPDIDMSGDIQFRFTPETVQQAAAVLQNEFQNNMESRKALIKSIESVLKEMPDDEVWTSDVAEKIANRIVGLEK